MTKVAFIGLGEMGGPMAANLVKAGFEVTATDLSIGAIDRAVDAGCQRGETVAACVKDADFVVTMLPGADHVISVYTDNYGVIANGRASAVFIDCSTIDNEAAQLLIAAAAARGFQLISAPTKSGPAEAQAGTLNFSVHGENDAIERARPVLNAMGRR